MKKKKIIIASLILAMSLANMYPSLAAKANTEETQIKENMEEKVKETYAINEIGEESVILNKKGADSDLVSVPKKEFKDIDLKVGKEVNITSDGINMLSEPGQFSKIYEIEEVGDSSKEEKITEKFIVKEINEEAVTVEKEGSEGELYTLSKKYFAKDISLGDRYEISHNDIVMNSYPAQFNKIYDVKKLEDNREITSQSNIYRLVEINRDSYIVEFFSKEDGSGAIEDSGDLYTIPKEKVEADVKIGDKLKITHSEEILESNPAQFARIDKVEKIDEKTNELNDKNTNQSSENKKNNEEEKGEETSKKASKNPKTGISFSLISLSALSLSLGGLKISKKK